MLNRTKHCCMLCCGLLPGLNEKLQAASANACARVAGRQAICQACLLGLKPKAAGSPQPIGKV